MNRLGCIVNVESTLLFRGWFPGRNQANPQIVQPLHQFIQVSVNDNWHLPWIRHQLFIGMMISDRSAWMHLANKIFSKVPPHSIILSFNNPHNCRLSHSHPGPPLNLIAQSATFCQKIRPSPSTKPRYNPDIYGGNCREQLALDLGLPMQIAEKKRLSESNQAPFRYFFSKVKA